MDSSLINYMTEQLRHVPMEMKRYMYNILPWDQRMVGLIGPRGIGKTTLFLQWIREHYTDNNDILYVSADHAYFLENSILDTGNQFALEGGKILFIDEIHKYPQWSQQLKNLYDGHPSLRIFFTGSSILDISKGNADLSRRALMFSMQGLSFREYLNLFHGKDLPALSITDIVQGKSNKLDIESPMQYFGRYLKSGYYPLPQDEYFERRLQQVINQTVEIDIPQYAHLNASLGRKLRQLMAIIARSVPFKPSMTSISNALSISRNIIGDYLMMLDNAGMIALLSQSTTGVRGLGKMEKIYLDNTNIAFALSDNSPDTGNIRETFFYNQMRLNNDVKASPVADFKINNLTFEVGGKNKGRKQVAGIDNAFVVKDDIDQAFGNILPLWAFGMNY